MEDIDISTFEKYLKELQEKYSPGTPINSPKYSPFLDNAKLEGKQILEIPESNSTFAEIQKYKDIALSKYGIEIRFRPE